MKHFYFSTIERSALDIDELVATQNFLPSKQRGLIRSRYGGGKKIVDS